jgi:hypothetical protein
MASTDVAPIDVEKTPNTFDDAHEEDAVRKVTEMTGPSKDAQNGVRNVEAVTLTWTKSSLAFAFVW